MHASSMHTYLEVVGGFATYTLDPRSDAITGMPRTISVVTNMSLDYVSAALQGDEIYLEANVIKIGKLQALMEVNMLNKKG